jgi:hypothetical protein
MNEQQEALLGLATTGELLAELKARAELDGRLGYRTVDGEEWANKQPRVEAAPEGERDES